MTGNGSLSTNEEKELVAKQVADYKKA